MGRSKGVEHECVGHCGKTIGELGSIRSLPRFEAGVLEEHDAVTGLAHRLGGPGPADVWGDHHRESADLRQRATHRSHREGRIRSFGPPQVAAHDDAGAPAPQLGNGGYRGADPEVVPHGTVG